MNETQKKIVNSLIDDNTISALKLAEKLQLNVRYVERSIQKLKANGILIRHGSPKEGYWEATINPKKEGKK